MRIASCVPANCANGGAPYVSNSALGVPQEREEITNEQ